jgi:hypothetical protein
MLRRYQPMNDDEAEPTIPRKRLKSANISQERFFHSVENSSEFIDYLANKTDSRKRYVLVPMMISAHMCFLLIDRVAKEFIYFNPMNVGTVLMGDQLASEEIEVRKEQKLIQDFFTGLFLGKKGYEGYQFVFLDTTMIECQIFLEGSRNRVDRNSHDGYCAPMAYFICDAILTYRELLPGNICLKHFVKHFICNPYHDPPPPGSLENYLRFLSGHTESQLDVDSEEFSFANSGPVEFINFRYMVALGNDFDKTCQQSNAPWLKFMAYCEDMIVIFRDERCDKIYAPHEGMTYSGLRRDEGYHGWVDMEVGEGIEGSPERNQHEHESYELIKDLYRTVF